jgi:predicted amidophosphoribosyltransferase
MVQLIIVVVAVLVVVGVLVVVLAMAFSGRRGSDWAACPSCGRKVARFAESCPHCGRALLSGPE